MSDNVALLGISTNKTGLDSDTLGSVALHTFSLSIQPALIMPTMHANTYNTRLKTTEPGTSKTAGGTARPGTPRKAYTLKPFPLQGLPKELRLIIYDDAVATPVFRTYLNDRDQIYYWDNPHARSLLRAVGDDASSSLQVQRSTVEISTSYASTAALGALLKDVELFYAIELEEHRGTQPAHVSEGTRNWVQALYHERQSKKDQAGLPLSKWEDEKRFYRGAIWQLCRRPEVHLRICVGFCECPTGQIIYKQCDVSWNACSFVNDNERIDWRNRRVITLLDDFLSELTRGHFQQRLPRRDPAEEIKYRVTLVAKNEEHMVRMKDIIGSRRMTGWAGVEWDTAREEELDAHFKKPLDWWYGRHWFGGRVWSFPW